MSDRHSSDFLITALASEVVNRLEVETPNAITADLISRGIPADGAVSFVRQVNRSLRSDRALRNIIWGTVICGIGVAITAATYAAAEPGGTYFLAWGAMLFGGLRLLKGVVSSFLLFFSNPSAVSRGNRRWDNDPSSS